MKEPEKKEGTQIEVKSYSSWIEDLFNTTEIPDPFWKRENLGLGKSTII